MMNISENFRPRRSCLYMPGANPRALEKARGLDTDVIIMDLEDAVAPDAKADAREQIRRALAAGGFGYREVWIRINAVNSDWGNEDLNMVLEAQPHGLLLPKVSNPNDITQVHQRIAQTDGGDKLAVWAMIETPMGILNLKDIASLGATTALQGFVIGTNDLSKDLRLPVTDDRTALLPIISQIVTAARAFNLEVIDGVWNDISNPEGLEAECLQGQQFGCDGKTLIHPSQLAVANRIFSPAQEAVEHAYKIRAAFNDPANFGKGVIKVDGQMTELLHRAQAERLIAFAEALETRPQEG